MRDVGEAAANTGIYRTESEALSAVVQRIVNAVDPEAIWLFGSRARGTGRRDSDFDLLVVTKTADGDAASDYERVYAPVLGTGVGCDVVPIRLDDFQRESEGKTGLVREVLRDGIALYDKHQDRGAPRAGR